MFLAPKPLKAWFLERENSNIGYLDGSLRYSLAGASLELVRHAFGEGAEGRGPQVFAKNPAAFAAVDATLQSSSTKPFKSLQDYMNRKAVPIRYVDRHKQSTCLRVI